MKIRIKSILSIFLFLFLQKSFSQGIAIGEWRDHLPYNNCISVTEGNGKVYCATKYAVFSYDKSDNSLQRMTKVNYLSDIGVSRVAFHKSLSTLIVTYTNGNIDLIENDVVTNLSDIKRKIIPGLKSINNVLFIDNYAYLSCGFGIVVLDVERKEIKNTYYIGLNGAHINVLDMAFDGTKLYAATEAGVYEATLNDPNLSDYHSWTKHTEMPHPDLNYNAITYFHNILYVNYSGNAYSDDTLYIFKNGLWNYFDSTYTSDKFGLHVQNDELIVIEDGDIDFFDSLGVRITRIYTYNWSDNPTPPSPRDAIIDESQNDIVWIADKNLGIVKNKGIWNSTAFMPNGPNTINAINISVEDNNLWVIFTMATGYFLLLMKNGLPIINPIHLF
jgi:hypothetical protein